MLLELIRDGNPFLNWGEMYLDGVLLGQTLEDEDRHLENGGEKDYGDTAIPRGRYRVTLSFSNRFQKLMPEVHDVPGFVGIRIHGGNTTHNTMGCPLLGSVRTADGIAKCSYPNEKLIDALEYAAERNEPVWLEVR